MADITKCTGGDCPRKENCYRFTAVDSAFWQSYFTEVPMKKDGQCDNYWPLAKKVLDSKQGK